MVTLTNTASICAALIKAFDNEDRAEFENLISSMQGDSSYIPLPKEWTITNGIKPGLQAGTVIRVLFRNLDTMNGYVNDYWWEHRGRNDDILAYQLR